MKALRFLAMLSPLATLFGCAHRMDLPDVTAKKFKAVHNNPWVSLEIEATNIVSTDDKTTAEKVVYHRNSKMSSGHIEIEGYERKKEPAK